MTDDIVLARSKHTQRVGPMSRVLANRVGAEILDGPTHSPDGRLLPVTTKTGRPVKPTTTVADQAAAKAVTPSASNEKETAL